MTATRQAFTHRTQPGMPTTTSEADISQIYSGLINDHMRVFVPVLNIGSGVARLRLASLLRSGPDSRDVRVCPPGDGSGRLALRRPCRFRPRDARKAAARVAIAHGCFRSAGRRSGRLRPTPRRAAKRHPAPALETAVAPGSLAVQRGIGDGAGVLLSAPRRCADPPAAVRYGP
jgi:hypothetical protein